MKKSLLEICKQVAGELSFSVPPAVLSSSDVLTQQIRYLVQNAAEELLLVHDWQALLKVGSISLTGLTEYTLPDDVSRILPNSFNVSNSASINLVGSTSPQYFQKITTPNGVLNSVNQITFQVFGNKIKIYPATSGGTLTFIYVSTNFISNSAGTVSRASFQEDGDFPIFDSRLLTNLVKMKLLSTKGLDNSASTMDYNQLVDIVKAMDTPAPILSLQQSSTPQPHTYTAIDNGSGIMYV